MCAVEELCARLLLKWVLTELSDGFRERRIPTSVVHLRICIIVVRFVVPHTGSVIQQLPHRHYMCLLRVLLHVPLYRCIKLDLATLYELHNCSGRAHLRHGREQLYRIRLGSNGIDVCVAVRFGPLGITQLHHQRHCWNVGLIDGCSNVLSNCGHDNRVDRLWRWQLLRQTL